MMHLLVQMAWTEKSESEVYADLDELMPVCRKADENE